MKSLDIRLMIIEWILVRLESVCLRYKSCCCDLSIAGTVTMQICIVHQIIQDPSILYNLIGLIHMIIYLMGVLHNYYYVMDMGI